MRSVLVARPAVRAVLVPARALAAVPPHVKPGTWVGVPPKPAEEVYPELTESQQAPAGGSEDTTAVELKELQQGQTLSMTGEPIVMTRSTPPHLNPRAIRSKNPNRPNWYFHRRQKPKHPPEYPGMFGFDKKPEPPREYPKEFENFLRSQELPPRPPKQEGEQSIEEQEPEMFQSTATRQYSVARYRNLRISPFKLNEILRPLRGLSVQEALNQLKFSHNPKSVYVRNSIHNAKMSAIHNFGMNPDRLYVYRAFATKAAYRKKIDYKARGRFGIRNVYASHMTIVLKEMEQTKIKGKIQQYHEVRVGMHPQKIGITHARLERIQQKMAEAQAIKEKLAQAAAAAAQPDVSPSSKATA